MPFEIPRSWCTDRTYFSLCPSKSFTFFYYVFTSALFYVFYISYLFYLMHIFYFAYPFYLYIFYFFSLFLCIFWAMRFVTISCHIFTANYIAFSCILCYCLVGLEAVFCCSFTFCTYFTSHILLFSIYYISSYKCTILHKLNIITI